MNRSLVSVKLPIEVITLLVAQLNQKERKEVVRSVLKHKPLTEKQILLQSHAIRKQLLREKPDAYIDYRS